MDLQLEEALERLCAVVPAPALEEVPLAAAAGRIAARPVLSPIDLPPFDNSAMDGYAVRAADVASASPENPVRLRVAARTPAGEVPAQTIRNGECVRLFTGSVLPTGGDAVVMQEDTRPGSPDTVLVLNSVLPGENIRRRGEDVGRGAAVCEAGDRLSAGRLSLLGAAGASRVMVARRPSVAVMATGSELREPGDVLAHGQIYESNRLGLAALIEQAGARPRVLPIVPDHVAATQTALAAALNACDVVVTSGGVSVGELDLVKRAFEDIGGRLEFWRVAMKPGRPFTFGRFDSKLLFGLPGNPVSSLVTFLLLVRPALLRFQGARQISLPSCPGRLAEALANDGGRRHFMRVRIDAEGNVRSAGAQASHLLSSMAAANGLLDTPPHTALPAGAAVRVLRWDLD
jgi:molybdopterin molybdotransferase